MSGVTIAPEGDDQFDGRPLGRRAPSAGRRDSQHHDEERYVPEESADGHEYDEPGVDESAYSDANDDGEARDQTQDYARLSGSALLQAEPIRSWLAVPEQQLRRRWLVRATRSRLSGDR